MKRKLMESIEKQSIRKEEEIPNYDIEDMKNIKDRST